MPKTIDINIKTNVEGQDEVEGLNKLIKALQDTEGEVNDNIIKIKVNGEEIETATRQTEKLGEETEKVTNQGSSGYNNLNSAIMGVASALGMAGLANKMWESATEKQTNNLLLARKYGVQCANDISNAIREIVSATPGDDTFLTSMLSNASLQAKMTTKELEKMAKAIADYQVMSRASGSTDFEAQGEIRNYIMSGETGRMRDTPLAPFLDQLQDLDTVQERVEALNNVLEKLGYSGASGINSASNSMEEFKGQIDNACATVGLQFLPVLQTVLNAFNSLNQATGGALGVGIIGLIGTIGGLIAFVQTVQTVRSAIDELRKAQELLTIANLKETASTVYGKVVKAGETVVNTMRAGAQWLVNNALIAGVFAQYTFLAPLLLIIGAILAIIGVLFLLGQRMGWWKDWGGFINVVKTRIMEVWNAIVKFGQIVYLTLAQVGACWNSTFGKIINKARTIISQIINFFRNLPSQIRSALSNLWNIITSPFKKAYNTIVGVVNNIKSTIHSIPVIGGVTDALGLTAGFNMSGGAGGTFTTGESLSSIVKNTNSSGSVVVNINGIVENDAKEYIVNAVSDRINKERLITGNF